MKYAVFAVGVAAMLAATGSIAQTITSGARATPPAPYVPQGFEPIGYVPATTQNLTAPTYDVLDQQPSGGYVATSNATGGYVLEDLQADFNANIANTIVFEFDKAEITLEAQEVLRAQSRWLQQNLEATVHLTGHTDAVGPDSYNYQLGLRRAKSAELYLVGLGVERTRMKTVVSKGEQELAVPTDRRELRNRRVITMVTGVRKVPLPVPVAVAPPPAPVRQSLPPRLPKEPTKPEPIQRAAIPEYTAPPRNYLPEPPSCGTALTSGSTTSGAHTQDLSTLRSELEDKMNSAIVVYNDPNVVNRDSTLFYWAHFTKVECGIAVGYSKSGTRDQRSIDSCNCGIRLVSHYQNAT